MLSTSEIPQLLRAASPSFPPAVHMIVWCAAPAKMERQATITAGPNFSKLSPQPHPFRVTVLAIQSQSANPF